MKKKSALIQVMHNDSESVEENRSVEPNPFC